MKTFSFGLVAGLIAAGAGHTVPATAAEPILVRQAQAAESRDRSRPPLPKTLRPPPRASGAKKPSRLQLGLEKVLNRIRQQPATSAAALSTTFPHMRFATSANQTLISIEVAAADPESLADQLRALGAQNVSRFGRLLSAQVPVDALSSLSANSSVKFARPVLARTHIGAAQSQGDFALRAPLVRPPAAPGGLTGTGVTVGVLSDSYDCLGGEAADLSSGDITVPVTVLKDLPGCADATDEGRAMVQLIADVAPGSSQSFYTAFDGQADFANGILALAAAGADVIVDDVLYFAEPMFLDGIISQAADQVVADGVPYFSSAGNSASRSYEAPFVPGSTGFIWGNGPFHDFGDGFGEFQLANVHVGTDIQLAFQWDDAFFSADPASPGAATDVDIYLLDRDGNIVAASEAGNTGGDPFELLSFFNNDHYGDGSIDFYVYVEIFSGPVPSTIKYVDFGSSNAGSPFADVVPFTDSGTVYGKAAAAGAFAAGAAFYGDTPECGASPAQLEFFSSFGGTPILREPNGMPIMPVVRLKPDAVGPDGGNTTFFGSDIGFASAIPECNDADALPNFFGTSASAPHLAAVAALMLEKDPTATPIQIYDAMTSTASEMGSEGPDFATGFGYVRADDAIALIGAGSTDSDGDGMSDAYEDANGLDKNDPNDAGLDPDSDGLSNLEEFHAGSNPQSPDSDSDGLLDGADAQPLIASNVCADGNNQPLAQAAFADIVAAGVTAQCAATESIEVQAQADVNAAGARLELFAPQVDFKPGFSLPVGAWLSVRPGV